MTFTLNGKFGPHKTTEKIELGAAPCDKLCSSHRGRVRQLCRHCGPLPPLAPLSSRTRSRHSSWPPRTTHCRASIKGLIANAKTRISKYQAKFAYATEVKWAFLIRVAGVTGDTSRTTVESRGGVECTKEKDEGRPTWSRGVTDGDLGVYPLAGRGVSNLTELLSSRSSRGLGKVCLSESTRAGLRLNTSSCQPLRSRSIVRSCSARLIQNSSLSLFFLSCSNSFSLTRPSKDIFCLNSSSSNNLLAEPRLLLLAAASSLNAALSFSIFSRSFLSWKMSVRVCQKKEPEDRPSLRVSESLSQQPDLVPSVPTPSL